MPKGVIPKRLGGRFEYKKALGKGGGGEVFLVSDRLRNGLEMALKVQGASNNINEKEFVYLSRLAHPHLVRVYDMGRLDDRTIYFTQEFLGGKEIDSYSGADIRIKLELLGQMLNAVEYLHNNGVIHGDIKPSHVIVSRIGGSDRIKMIDFGVASHVSQDKSYISGTLPYLAPECFHGEGIGKRTDLYSLGLVLFELFTGRFPFKGKDVGALLRQKEAGPSFSKEEEKYLPAAIKEILKGILSPDPRQRFSNAGEIKNILTRTGLIKKEEAALPFSENLVRNDPALPGLMEWSNRRLSVILGQTSLEAGAAKDFVEREWQIKGGHVITCDLSIENDLLRSIARSLYLLMYHDAQICKTFGALIAWAYPELGDLPRTKFDRKLDFAEAVSQFIKEFTTKVGPLNISIDNFGGLSKDDQAALEYMIEKGKGPLSFLAVSDESSYSRIDTEWIDRAAVSGLAKTYRLATTSQLDPDRLEKAWRLYLGREKKDLLKVANFLSLFAPEGCAETVIDLAAQGGLITFSALDRLISAGWLRPASLQGGVSYHFISEVLSKNLISKMSEEDIRDGHLKIARILKGKKGFEPAYLRHALKGRDKGLCFEELKRIATILFDSYRYKEALELLKLAAHSPSLKGDKDGITILRARAALNVGETESVIELLEGIEDIASNPEAAINLSSSYLRAGDYDKARKTVQPLLGRNDRFREKGFERYLRAFLEEGDYRGIIEAEGTYGLKRIKDGSLETTIGLAYFYLGDFEKSREYFNRVAASGDVYMRASAMNCLGMLNYNQGQLKEALEFYKEAASEFAKIWAQWGLLSVAMNTGTVWHVMARYDKALENYGKALEIARQCKQVSTEAILLNNFANIYLVLGQVRDSLEYLSMSSALADKHGIKMVQAYNQLIKGDVFARQDNFKDALKSSGGALSIFESINAMREVAIAHLNCARYDIRLGDHQGARDHLKKAGGISEKHDLAEQKEEALVLEARLSLSGKDGLTDEMVERLKGLFERYESQLRSERALEMCSILYDWFEKTDKIEASLIRKRAREIILNISAELPYNLKETYTKLPENAKLLPKEENGEDEMKVDALKKLLELNRKITAQLDVEKLLAEIMDAAIEITGAERGFIIMADEGGRKGLGARVARNLDKEDIKKSQFKISRSIAEKVLKTGVPILTTDAQEDPRFKAAMSVQGLKLRSVISVPLKYAEKSIGVVYLDNRFQKNIFTEDDLNMLTAFADQASIAVENARLYSENVRKQNELEEKGREIGALNEKLSSIVAKQNVELESISKTLTLKQRDLEFKYNYHNIIGKSPSMQTVFQILDRVTDTESTVLITGESGTGKELVAHAVHYNGPRKKAPFLSINCAAIPENLLESELFGHKKGAFTGAIHDKAGMFEEATGGTLFLDEIGEMPLGMQVKLLRVLQNGKIRRVGSTAEISTDVRIIAATNKDLSEEVRSGRFREDLFYRLNVLPVRLPPLRERKEDIPLLIERIIARFAKAGRERKVSPSAMRRLLSQDWAGNVRELENTIERAVIMSDGDIEPHHLPLDARGGSDGLSTKVAESGNLKDIRTDLEKRMIVETLAQVGGNKSNAAKRLGLSRYGLYKKLNRYNLE